MTAPIRPADQFGAVLAGRGQAELLRAQVEQLVRAHEPVVVDFTGVVTVSPSFADEFFAKLDPTLFDRGDLRVEGVAPSIAAIARFVKLGRTQTFR